MITAISPCSSLLATFCEEERLRLSDRNSILRWKVLTGQTRLISLWYCGTWAYSFALMRISPSDISLLYEMMGGSLYISPSSGWSWIKCHLLIKMFLGFGKPGWYVVMKGRIFFRTSLLSYFEKLAHMSVVWAYVSLWLCVFVALYLCGFVCWDVCCKSQ